jgi:DNA-directed RNA polymerase subunit beta
MATVSEFGFIQTPYRKIANGKVSDRDHLPRRCRGALHDQRRPPSRSTKTGRFVHEHVLCRSREGEAVMAAPKEIEFMDVSPAQIVSIATAMIPFLAATTRTRAQQGEHAAAGRAADDPASAARRRRPQYRAAVDSGDVVVAKGPAT